MPFREGTPAAPRRLPSLEAAFQAVQEAERLEWHRPDAIYGGLSAVGRRGVWLLEPVDGRNSLATQGDQAHYLHAKRST